MKYASSLNGFKMEWMEVAGPMYLPIFSLKLHVVKARVPNQKRPRERRVGVKTLGGRFSLWSTKWWWWIGLCDAWSKTMSVEKSKYPWQNTRFWIFVFWHLWAFQWLIKRNFTHLDEKSEEMKARLWPVAYWKANLLGQLFGHFLLLNVGVSSH